MELVKGQTLRQLAKDSVSATQVAETGAQAARALAVAHEAGIVHRDIKHTRSGSTLSPEACFRAAVDLARKHGAKSFELRSSVALGHVMVERGLNNEAKTPVRNIREQFSEGFDTQDLRDADAFLIS